MSNEIINITRYETINTLTPRTVSCSINLPFIMILCVLLGCAEILTSFAILLKSMIEKLPPRDRKIIIMRYYRDNTQSEIAKELGVSQVQVSRIENKIINQFKSQL